MFENRYVAELVERARRSPKKLVFPELDVRVLRASRRLLDERIASCVTLVGKEDAFKALSAREGIDLSGTEIRDSQSEADEHLDRFWEVAEGKRMRVAGRMREVNSRKTALEILHEPLPFALMLLLEGEVDGYLAGALCETADTLSPAVAIIGRQKRAIIFSTFLCYAADTVFIFADCGLLMNPSPWALARMAGSCSELMRLCHPGVEARVAFLSYATDASATSRAVLRVRAAAQMARERYPGLISEGPLQGDAALVPHIARAKFPDSRIQGDANILLFPDLNAGNIAYKLVERFVKMCGGNISFVGPVALGFRRPANDVSRGCTSDDFFLTAAVTVIQAQASPQPGPERV